MFYEPIISFICLSNKDPHLFSQCEIEPFWATHESIEKVTMIRSQNEQIFERNTLNNKTNNGNKKQPKI